MNKATLLSISLLFIGSILSYGQGYKIADIPDSLISNADAVIMYEEAKYNIESLKKTTYTQKQVIAILNEQGADMLSHEVIYYDSHTDIKYFKFNVYNQFGDLVLKSKKSDVYDRSAVSDFSLYEDGRLQYLKLGMKSYPYIVEISYQKTSDNNYSFERWFTRKRKKVSVMESKLILAASNPSLLPNAKVYNSDKNFTYEESDDEVKQTIAFQGLIAKKQEPFGMPIRRLSPYVITSPKSFQYDGYQGDYSSWDNIAKWQMDLNEDRQDISEEHISAMKQGLDSCQNWRDSVKHVYKFVQNRTRYVSIQLGIGGWQPFPASTVEKYGYGDCKALSNYTYSLLDAIGIESIYTKVFGGRNQRLTLDKGFPSNYFNHIILCVPDQKDTVWLECTSQTNPFDYQGNFTGDRDVLLVTPNGGKVAHTHRYDELDNQINRTTHLRINQNGQMTGDSQVTYTGLEHETKGLKRAFSKGHEQQKKWILKNTNINNLYVDQFQFSMNDNRLPSIHQTTNFHCDSYLKNSGGRLFIKGNLYSSDAIRLKANEDRESDIIIGRSYTHTDSIFYHFDGKVHHEYLPEDFTVSSTYGEYTISYHKQERGVLIRKKLMVKKGRYDKSMFEKFRKFINSIAEQNNKKMVIKYT